MKLPNKIGLVVLAGAWIALAFPMAAHAITTLKQVQVTDGSQIDLLFDGSISPAQVKTEFFNDIIQLSINHVAVYPAKISAVSGSELTKIFAYQYSPKLVRCRLTVKGKAESFENRLQLKASGKVLTVRLDDRVTVRSAHPAPTHSASSGINDPEERALLERVMKAPLPAAAPAVGAPTAATKSKPAEPSPNQQSAVQSAPVSSGNGKLASGKHVVSAPSILRTIGMLIVVLAAFGAFALLLKRFGLKGRGDRASSLLKGMAKRKSLGMGDLINRFVRHGLGGGDKMIEVVATHYLGPKQSIAMVKVAGRMLVLGVSNESINLITELPAADGDIQPEGIDFERMIDPAPAVTAKPSPMSGASAAGRPIFSDLLSKEQVKPAAAAPTTSVRARIRDRLGA